MTSISVSRSRPLDVVVEFVQFSVHVVAGGVGVGSAFPGKPTSPPLADESRQRASREIASILLMDCYSGS